MLDVTRSDSQPGRDARIGSLLQGHSLEMTAKDVVALEEAAGVIPQGTRIAIAFLPGETFEARLHAAVRVRSLGFDPAPHISARRIASESELRGFLENLSTQASIQRLFVVAGDPPVPEGPYEDALSLIRSGMLNDLGLESVGVSGYPEGHPDIGEPALWGAMFDKRDALAELGISMTILTQFGFDAEPIVHWVERVRSHGIDALIRIGVPGPAGIKTLLRFAARCGVGASAKVMSKYGLSLTQLMGTAGPDRLIEDLADRIDPARHGPLSLHFYPFGGIARTAEWVSDFAAKKAA
ncbi:methylenetetrahydrofolate reductase [Brevundimonas aurifodinae]|uniref:Methylenetetrahydrofolate reductase n=2 Tax=Brevundimonas TaxID=41275 RepID=A0ABV1NM66_9CAUL|nr:MAG: 5,10-methylenetetrahydrofolate reductase [Brevundimonas sp. 12-68-7]OYX36081.1 MAG: 5,10-methylenetetrahydrofolate reductase [Brevundimonas subvibrioides]